MEHSSIKQHTGRRDGEERHSQKKEEEERKSREMGKDRPRGEKEETEVETAGAYGICLE